MADPKPLNVYTQRLMADLAAKNRLPKEPERISALADFFRFIAEMKPAIERANGNKGGDPLYAVAMGDGLYHDFWIYLCNKSFQECDGIAEPPNIIEYYGIRSYIVATMPPFMWGLTRFEAIKAEVER